MIGVKILLSALFQHFPAFTLSSICISFNDYYKTLNVTQVEDVMIH
jgi:hypothetical protein